MEFSALDISSSIGILALIILTLNFILGTMLSTAYKRSVYWKKLPLAIRKININKVHNWTAYLALVLILMHPFILLLDKEEKFLIADIVVPFVAPKQPNMVGLGVLALYLIFIVIITTQKRVKKALGFRFWKNLHLLSYCTVILISIHGIFLDPQLKDRNPDFLDGEKLICELCLLAIIIISVLRFRQHLNYKSASNNKLTD